MAKELTGIMKKLMAKSKKAWDAMENKRREDRLKEAQKASLEELRILRENGSKINPDEKVTVTMTDLQIQNWRKLLATQFGLGPLAFIMSKEEIQKIKNNMQGKMDALGGQLKEGKE